MNTKTGLVLEGGAMRGIFTAGALDVMMENTPPALSSAAITSPGRSGAPFDTIFGSATIPGTAA